MKKAVLIVFAFLFVGCSQQIIKPEVITVVSYARLDSAEANWNWSQEQLSRQIDSLSYDLRWLQSDSTKDSVVYVNVPVKRGTRVTRSYSLDTTTSRGDSVHVKFTLGRYEGAKWSPPFWELRVVPHPDTSSHVDVPAIIDAVAPTLWGLVPMWVKIGSVLVIIGVIVIVILKKKK